MIKIEQGVGKDLFIKIFGRLNLFIGNECKELMELTKAEKVSWWIKIIETINIRWNWVALNMLGKEIRIYVK